MQIQLKISKLDIKLVASPRSKMINDNTLSKEGIWTPFSRGKTEEENNNFLESMQLSKQLFITWKWHSLAIYKYWYF